MLCDRHLASLRPNRASSTTPLSATIIRLGRLPSHGGAQKLNPILPPSSTSKSVILLLVPPSFFKSAHPLDIVGISDTSSELRSIALRTLVNNPRPREPGSFDVDPGCPIQASHPSPMQPLMPPRQYMPTTYAVFSSPHLDASGNALPHSAPSYDHSSYAHDPYAQFDLSKPVNQFQYMPSGQSGIRRDQDQQGHSQSPQLNNYVLSSSTPTSIYQLPQPQRRDPQQPLLSCKDSSSTPNPGSQSVLRAPKFDRTYTDAIEDELYDESTHNPSPSSTRHDARLPASSFAFQNIPQYHSNLYVDNTTGFTQAGAPSSQESHLLPQPSLDSQQPVSPRLGYDNTFDPLHHSQQISSAAVADSVRRLKAPNRTTVSPREAFLDYPDNADFREKRLFSSSRSPYSNGHDNGEISGPHESESAESTDEDFQVSDSLGPTSSIPMNSAPYLHDPRATSRAPILPATSSRSNSSSTRHSAMRSGDASRGSSNGSESEYNPAASRRAGRSSGRGNTLSKTFSCVDCGKRFDRSQNLQTHRRKLHGKTTGPARLPGFKFSNTSHQCDFVDPTTGKTCNTVFSRP